MAGNIKKVGNAFRVCLEYERDVNNKRVRKYKQVNSNAEAKRLLRDHEYQQQRNLSTNPKDTYFSDFWITGQKPTSE